MALPETSLILAALLLVLLAGGLWIAVSMIVVGGVAVALFTNTNAGALLATTVFGGSTDWALTALPLFIWMGEILFRTRLADRMFSGLAPWMSRLPGRLAHTNVLACGIFAAVSGSSTATTATIGRITVAELTRRGYDDKLVLGSLAGSGTLGILIPPSIIMIVYGVAAEVSIPKLFIAGVIPGILLSLLFSAYIVIWALLYPEKTPPPERAATLVERIAAGRYVIPVVLLIIAVLGSIYTGVATATEAAVLGVVGTLVLSFVLRSLTWEAFRGSVVGAFRTSCMIGLIIAGAAFLTVSIAFTGLPRLLAAWVIGLGLSKGMLIAALTVIYLIMGCFVDGISIVVLTASVFLPTIRAAGIDMVWFGVFLVLVSEMACVTPPVGFNLFVIQSLSGRSIGWTARAALPFFFLMVAMVAILTAWPVLATWLPSLIM
ncbi:MAG TPA: TRAP transporter large permease subunit [Candidatus Methylomirabilis sp.]|nr:TRAP transporter large permease subunit [Candidatus Methylomirabilis sp.]